jgi:YHS domain-containing protein
MAVDPVCKMEVDEKKAKLFTDYRGRKYFFCSSACKERFDTTLASLKKTGTGSCFGVRVEEAREIGK